MISEFVNMDTQEKICYVSESSNASTSGCSTMSPVGINALNGGGNLSPASSGFSMPSSPAAAHSPGTVTLQTEFSNLNLPSTANSPHNYIVTQHQMQQIQHPYQSNFLQQQPHYGNNLTNATTIQAQFTQQQQHHFNMHSISAVSAAMLPRVKSEYTAKIHILEQPVEKFRFRYKSEMHGTHGSLTGANSKRTPKTFPEVELRNFHGRAIIRCSLFQTNLDSPHSHQLVVRREDADICDPHDLQVSPESGFVAQFQNMGIIHTAKKFIFDELVKKKMNRLKFELGREELSTKQMQELHKETEKEAKDMNLNQVRLCFEAFKIEDNNAWTRIAAPVYSNPINNRKSAQTGELRICRLSIATGNVVGGDDLILLVEKVSKKNIRVRFYELDEDEELIWEAYGRFRESDVHHQYAIVCQTPAYKDKDIDRPVEVNIELVRPSDDERSYPPITFRYKPREAVSRKRRRTCSTATSSSGSGSSASSFELPKTLQEQTQVNVNLAVQHNKQVSAGMMEIHHAAGGPSISEEYNKSLELSKLVNSEELRKIINANSEELSKYCPIFPEFDENLLQHDSVGGQLVTDGISTSSDSVAVNKSSMELKKMLILNNVLQTATVAGNDVYLQRIFKIYDELRTGKQPTAEQMHEAAKKIADVFAEHAEKSEHGDTLVHEIVIGNNHKAGIKTCHILSFFKLTELLNRCLNSNNESALHCACINDRAHYVRPLLGLGIDPNIQDSQGNTALHIAVKEEHQQCIESFLNMKNLAFDLNIRNDEGLTPLHLAIRQCNYEVTKKLLQHNKNAALTSNRKDGNNALHMAIAQQNLELIKIILVDNQKIYQPLLKAHNAAGHTAIDLAKELHSTKVGNEIFQYITPYCALIDKDLLAIKEEDISSSSTEDDDDAALRMDVADVLELAAIKDECDDDEEDDDYTNASIEGTIDENNSHCQINKKYRLNTNDAIVVIDAVANNNKIIQNLKNILNDSRKFQQLVHLLNVADQWKLVAEKGKMQHLQCLWSNANDMLNYIKKQANSIEYEVFVKAISEVNKIAFEMLQLG